MSDPALFGLGRGLDAVEALVAQIEDAIGDPFDVLLDRRQHVGQHRRTARPGDREEVGEPGDAEPEIGLGPFAPLVGEPPAAGAGYVDLQQRPGHRIKAGGEDDGIDRVFLSLCPDAGRNYHLDRFAADVDQGDVRAVERRPIPGVDAEPLAADNVCRRQHLGGVGVVDDLADLAADEFGRQIVGPLVEQQIAKDADKRQAAIGPARLELALPLLLADGQGRRHVEIEVEARDRRLRPRPQPRIIGLDRRLVFRVELLVVRRDRVIRRPLEDIEMGGLSGN